MSSTSSFSTSSTSKASVQATSAPHTPRIYTRRKLSSARRVREMRNLPEYDSRGLLADPLKAYSQPDALYEEKIKLTQEIDSLLSEIVPLREQTQLISTQFEEPDRDPFEEAEERSKQLKIESYQNEIEAINKSIARFSELFTTKNEEELNGQIQSFRHEKNVLDSELEELEKQLNEKSRKLDDMNDPYYIETFQDNNDRITENEELLKHLRKEEMDLLALHELLLKSEPTESSINSKLLPYQRQLQQLEHIKTKRSVELKKIQRSYDTQTKSMEAIKADKEKKAKERKNREAWNKSFKSREVANEESRRKLEESQTNQPSNLNENDTTSVNFDDDDGVEYETIKRIVIHRHKHKRYHHKQHNEEEELIPPLENPLMFSTEVENTESLHITKPQQKEQ